MKKSILITLLPYVLWSMGTLLRPVLIHPHCITLERCQKEQINEIDRMPLGLQFDLADQLSFTTQYLSGFFAVSTSLVWHLTAGLGQPILSPLALFFKIDGLLFLQAIGWNGLMTETSHLLSQRPRPFVYLDVLHKGQETSHYTSFYSGHTSFATVTVVTAVLLLLRRKTRDAYLGMTLLTGSVLVFLTAYLRILAGKHFLTDVLGGLLGGSWVAYQNLKCFFKKRS